MLLTKSISFHGKDKALFLRPQCCVEYAPVTLWTTSYFQHRLSAYHRYREVNPLFSYSLLINKQPPWTLTIEGVLRPQGKGNVFNESITGKLESAEPE